MKKRSEFLLLMLLVLFGFISCVKREPASVTDNEEESKKFKLPTVVTDTNFIIRTPKEVLVGFNIMDDGGAAITVMGVCWSTTYNPTINNNIVEAGGPSLTGQYCYINGLEKSTTYYVRAFATNTIGTAYGNQVSFTTPASIPPIAFNPNLTYGSVKDTDGNIYKTIQIGTQTWITENLKTTRYNDGNPIYLGTGAPAGYTDWFNLGDGNYSYYNGAYCWFDNDSSTFADSYGAIYNWHAVGTGKLCPTGWHVPTNSDWTTLITTLGGAVEAINEMTENAMIYCSEYSINESGFTPAIQGELCGWGFLNSDLWWSATPRPTDLNVPYSYVLAFRIIAWEPQSYGYSVRCLKD